MSTPERIRAEQEVTRRYSAIMPVWMLSVIVPCLSVVALSRKGPGFLPTLAGTVCFVAMLAFDPRWQRADQQPRARDLP